MMFELGLQPKSTDECTRESNSPTSSLALEQNFFSPMRELFRRPAKGFRAEMLHLGYQLSGEDSERCILAEVLLQIKKLASVIESIHLGSLIVDDIQDDSAERRGGPSLHKQYGLNLALNAGNALYFFPLQLIPELDLPADMELGIYRQIHKSLYKAHQGQAIDLGTRIDQIEQSEVENLCLQTMRLKSGELTLLSLSLGGRLGRCTRERLQNLEAFGLRLGLALQMFDDLGNLSPTAPKEKRMEDLVLKRPSWVWAKAAQKSELEYFQFKEAVLALPDEGKLSEWLQRHHILLQGHREACDLLKNAILQLSDQLPSAGAFSSTLNKMHLLCERLAKNYTGKLNAKS